MGIEPTYLAWKASVLPLNYTRIYIKPFRVMPRAGIEPATRGFSVLCSTNWAIWATSCHDLLHRFSSGYSVATKSRHRLLYCIPYCLSTIIVYFFGTILFTPMSFKSQLNQMILHFANHLIEAKTPADKLQVLILKIILLHHQVQHRRWCILTMQNIQ